MDNLEQLLSQSMDKVADQGFSDEIIANIADFNRKRSWLFNSLYGFLAISLFTFFPVGEWLMALKKLLINNSYSLVNFELNNQQLATQLTQPLALFVITMVVMLILVRAEN